MTGALAGLVMLIIGDSHIAAMGHFNDALQDGLVAQGATVHAYGVCGAAARDWVYPEPILCGRGERHNSEPAVLGSDRSLRGWALRDLIAKHHPNLVVIELGDTMAGYGVTPTLPRELIADQVQLLLTPVKAQHLPCIWIGPPWGGDGTGPYKKTAARVEELAHYLPQVVAPCRFIDSLAFSRPGQWQTRDGLHLTVESYRAWDDDLVKSIVQIVSASRHQ